MGQETDDMKLQYRYDLKESSFSFGSIPTPERDMLPFQVHACGHFQTGNLYYTDREGLDTYLLLYTKQGAGILRYQGATHLLEPHMAVVIHCRNHQYYHTSDLAWDFHWVHFTGHSVPEYLRRMDGHGAVPFQIQDRTQFDHLFQSLFETMRQQSKDADMDCACLMNGLLTEMVRSGRSSILEPLNLSHQNDVDLAIKYIEAHYAQKISAGDILSPAHLSPWYFTRLFREYTGRSPYEYLIQHRLNMALQDLLQTNLKITTIADNNGFGDATQFIRRFRRHYGVTPEQFRRNIT